MQDQAQFEAYVQATLARYGMQADEVEMQIIVAAEQTYGPHRDALLAADLSDVAAEVGLDPSRAPADRSAPSTP